jgi:phosphatidate cytidylyltransferase
LKTRIITAIIFGLIVALGTMYSPQSSAILYCIVGILLLWEFYGLVLSKDGTANNFRKIYAVFLSIVPSLVALYEYFSPYPLWNAVVYQWLMILPLIPFAFELAAGSNKAFENIGFVLVGFLYLGLPAYLLTSMSLQDFTGRYIIMAVMLLVWFNDVFAYFIGKFFGRNKIFPNISPNKTWEGTIGGFIFAVLWGWASYFCWPVIKLELIQWLVLGAICSVFGIMGDLVASKLKRSLQIKDTGNILPGHGGLIDRFDAFIFTIPFVVFTLCYIFEDKRLYYFYLLWH